MVGLFFSAFALEKNTKYASRHNVRYFQKRTVRRILIGGWGVSLSAISQTADGSFLPAHPAHSKTTSTNLVTFPHSFQCQDFQGFWSSHTSSQSSLCLTVSSLCWSLSPLCPQPTLNSFLCGFGGFGSCFARHQSRADKWNALKWPKSPQSW